MQCRKDIHGDDVSVLGFGCMRFTKKAGKIDMLKAELEVLTAIELGVNYFDTAWLYPGSEVAIGEILTKNGLRDRVNIATKLPQYMVRKTSDFDKFFNEQLKRLQTDHIDYYLIHMLPDSSRWKELEDIGIGEWIEEKKNAGRIRNLGFSFHGSSDVFIELLDSYKWDFCQIQYNYLDVNSQGGVDGLQKAHALGIPVIVMEPLRGGKLVNKLPEGALNAFSESGNGWSPAEWGFRWLYNQPEIMCVLSGMNSEEMVIENCRIASDCLLGSFSDEDFKTIDKARDAIKATTKIGCTECRYCMPCPKGVDIPAVFAAFNDMFVDGKMNARVTYMQNVAFRENPGYARQCVDCGACLDKCPQHLEIPSLLKESEKALSPFPFKVAQSLIGKFM